MYRDHTLLLLLVLFLACAAATTAAESNHWGDLEAGPHAIGFHVERINDPTRRIMATAPDSERPFVPRPLMLAQWYPISDPETPHLKAGDYLTASASETFLSRPLDKEEARSRGDAVRAQLERWGASAERAREIFDSKVAAQRGGVALPDAPTVILAPMPLAPATHNWVLAEYLASHGFRVVGYAPYGLLPGFMDVGGADLENQVRDLEVIWAHLNGERARTVPTAVIGHSWSGMVALAAHTRNPWLTAVISLDGSEEYWRDVLEARPDFDTLRVRAPYLRFVRPGVIDSGFFDSLGHAAKWRVELAELTHGELAYLPLLRAETRAAAKEERSDVEIETKRAVYETLCRMVRAFLELHLGEVGSATDLLQGFEQAPGVRTIAHHAGGEPVPMEAALLRLWQNAGLEVVIERLDQLRREDPQGRSETIVTRFAELLMWTARVPREAKRVLEHLLAFYPESADLHEHLANNAWMAGDEAAATAHFVRALALDPARYRARESLRFLRADDQP